MKESEITAIDWRTQIIGKDDRAHGRLARARLAHQQHLHGTELEARCIAAAGAKRERERERERESPTFFFMTATWRASRCFRVNGFCCDLDQSQGVVWMLQRLPEKRPRGHVLAKPPVEHNNPRAQLCMYTAPSVVRLSWQSRANWRGDGAYGYVVASTTQRIRL